MKLSPQTIDICLELIAGINIQGFVRNPNDGAVQPNPIAPAQIQALHAAFAELQAARSELLATAVIENAVPAGT
jgi:hypothetical protein